MGVKEMIILICKDDFNSVYVCSFLSNYALLGCAVYCMLIILQSISKKWGEFSTVVQDLPHV